LQKRHIQPGRYAPLNLNFSCKFFEKTESSWDGFIYNNIDRVFDIINSFNSFKRT
jgi:hypothetical protein